ncbi:hypothetical protein [Natrialbaceae archaeon AArc-T1-2]|uniref:hypothetical protein n=1 Tax=Natrialbaceae archaeon AArc-T1-2 TaxID=3053904 RepID=UPI00255AD22E|nr:hypothetical protein [Natrialbaceae archaeon AArc-T1-2]WIV67027.1 hypothetical protein QQ977_15280 [Natrialbaceae archaeon AArc-T1-2]
MDDEQLIYGRDLLAARSWRNFAVGHVAFTLHRLTGWLLLAWIGIHLLVPILQASPSSVYNPTSTWIIVALLAVLVFHSFNGIRLVIVELGGLTASGNRLSFWLTVGASAALVILMGVSL